MSKEAIPNPVRGRMVGEVVGVINYFGSFVKIELCNLAGESAYFRLLYCRWKFYDGDQDLLDSETCDFNELVVKFSNWPIHHKDGNSWGCELWISFDGGELLIARPDLTTYEVQGDIAAFIIDETIYSLSP